MTRELKTHRYHGHLIAPCSYAKGEHDGRWVIPTQHPQTGLYWADNVLRHFQTLAEAKEVIDQEIPIHA